MRIIWQNRASPTPLSGAIHNAIYAFRTHSVYQAVLNAGRRHVVPLLLTFLMVWYGTTALSHFAFNVADSMGAFCKGTPPASLLAADKGTPQAGNEFDTSKLCAPTRLTVRAGFKYEIAVTMSESEPWQDDDKPTTPVGYRTSTMRGLDEVKGYATILLRRILFRPWYRLIARIGETGVDEYFLDPKPVPSTSPQVYRDQFIARRSGEIFLYVNDGVIGLPWLYDWFYRGERHRGKASVTIRLL